MKKKYFADREATEAELREKSAWILKGQQEDSTKKY